MKIVDLPGLVGTLEPLLAQRWQAAGLTVPRTRFTLASEIGSVGLTVSRRRVRVTTPAGPRVRIPQRWLSGLVTGYYTIADILPRQGTRVPRSLVPLMAALFPVAQPFVYQADNY